MGNPGMTRTRDAMRALPILMSQSPRPWEWVELFRDTKIQSVNEQQNELQTVTGPRTPDILGSKKLDGNYSNQSTHRKLFTLVLVLQHIHEGRI